MSRELKHLSAKVASGQMSRREFMGRAAALGVTTAAASLMLANAVEAAGPVKGGTFRMGIQGGASTDSKDPASWTADVPICAGRVWGEQLLDVNPDGNGLDPLLAESWESSPDAKTWRFKIRQGVEFHNGKTVTAEDVLQTMRRHSDDASSSGAQGILKGISQMRADGDVFEVNLDVASADLPYLMADYHLVIQPNGGYDDPAAGIGSGAYSIVSDEAGVRTRMVRNPNYWGGDEVAHYDEVEVIALNDTTARTAALQSGQVDAINRVDPKTAGLLDRAPNVNVVSSSGRGHYVFVMRIETAPFDNLDLRLALKYALNREEMVEKILGGYGSVGNDQPINAAYPLFAGDIPQRAFDLDKAAEHYRKSGHDGSPIVLHAAESVFPGALDAAALFQQSCRAAGIPLEVKREPDDGYFSEIWLQKPFCVSFWGGRPVQDQMFTTAYLSTADWNETQWKRPEFDAMLLEARAELDPARRTELYAQMSRMIHEEGGTLVPMFNDFVDAISSQVQNWKGDPTAQMMNWYAFKKTWKA